MPCGEPSTRVAGHYSIIHQVNSRVPLQYKGSTGIQLCTTTCIAVLLLPTGENLDLQMCCPEQVDDTTPIQETGV